ncbi:MAG: dephospho-CoA kinase [Flavobacteriaceae bacterium]|jgi:dephospho-CoA kinase|nr:dephospho-CoA kinase [Flavobacteriaceae bacterium]MBT4297839.1 dephospho-CoA kinase [Flavobacteriaceae bacterium]MBT4960622.1 dephospho-CoA kinase [Flavobacteriaceae bacterium]MBT5233077.1 dephospho-CoA kinase [Flavobacteriaceae bacterium]MBT5493310.1 dephospho-CoA kinase [Flavobacteriaceae bacterium]|tara:strand:- start:2066 stop:2653 length:588 start_codon:yes stop_codon:yes gene_type:complete
MKIIGLTGGIGSGKSTIAKVFKSNSVPVYDSDSSAKILMNSSKKLKLKLIECFGSSTYSNGLLNKKYVSNLIFNDSIALNKINSIVHPEVFNDFKQWKSKLNNDYVIYESALVFESGSYKSNDYNILVTSEFNLRVERIIKRDNIKKDDVLLKINNQWADQKKIPLADYVLKNSSENENRKIVLSLINHFNSIFV